MATDYKSTRHGIVMVTMAGLTAGYISVGCRVMSNLGFSLLEIVTFPSLLFTAIFFCTRFSDDCQHPGRRWIDSRFQPGDASAD